MFAEEFAQIGGVARRDVGRARAVDDDVRRVAPTLVRVLQFDGVALHQRRLVAAVGGLQCFGQFVGGKFGHGRAIDFFYRGQELADVAAVQRRDVEDFGVIDKVQFAFELAADGLALFVVEVVPFVDGDDEGAAAAGDFAEEVRVLFAHAFVRVQHEDDDVGALDGVQGFDDGEFFDFVVHPRLAADAGGVNQGEAVALCVFVGDGDGVARGAGDGACHQAFFADEAVEQGGFARVGTADDGQRDVFFLVFCLVFFAEQCGVGRFQQAGDDALRQLLQATAVFGGDGKGVRDAQRVEVGEDEVGVGEVGFVHREDDWLLAAAQFGGDGFVNRGQAVAAINDEDDDVRLGNRGTRLFINAAVNLVFFFAQEAAGIDDAAGQIGQFGFAVVAVAGEAGGVGDERVAAAGEGVVEGGFADVRPANKGDERFAAAGGFGRFGLGGHGRDSGWGFVFLHTGQRLGCM